MRSLDESRLRASALTLKFGELWQSLAKESFEEKRIIKFEYFLMLSEGEDVLLHVLTFLDPKSLLRVCSTCTRLYTFCTRPENQALLWTRHHVQLTAWLRATEPIVPLKRRYIKLLLLYYEAEYRHYNTLYRLLSALCQMPKGSVVNVLGNVGYFQDAAVSLAVSSYRQESMTAVILSRTSDAITFRKQTDFVGPVTFISQDSISPFLAGHFLLVAIDAPGFIDYAVNLIQLEKKDEYMRFTFLLGAYKNLSVWETQEAIDTARQNGTLPQHVPAVALDTFTPDRIMPTWYKTGKLASGSFPCFVAIGTNRPKLASQDALDQHMMKLETRRDRFRDSLAFYEM